MNEFVPYSKLSKKKKREIDLQKRGSWCGINPITRMSKNPKAYNRQKARNWRSKDFPSVPSVCFVYTLSQGPVFLSPL